MPAHELHNAKVQAQLKELARSIKKQMPEGWGFTLTMMEFDSPATFYLSSIDRGTAAQFLRELADKMDRDAVDSPTECSTPQ